MENNQRYYPRDPKGNLDEWGAVIKRQTEAYQRDQADKQIQKIINAKSYSNELDQIIA